MYIYPSLQSAYREHHSTETALLRVQNDILRAIDSKKEVLLVLLDLSAAFDTIDHDILISRLTTQFGFSGTVLKWFKSYLHNRTQKVVIGNAESELQPVTSGVPQGSVLGPLLFVLYVAPLQDIIISHGFDCMLYADDSQLYITMNPSCRQTALDRLDRCLKDIQLFFLKNKLVCNPTKTEIVHFLSRFSRLDYIPNIVIGSHTVATTTDARNLGVIFDRHMSMSAHVNKICRSAQFALRSIGRIRKYLSRSTTERLVHAFITSKLDYCNSLMCGLASKEISKLQRVQNSAARIVTRVKCREHITPILRSLHWLPIRERISFKLILLTYKSVNSLAPSYLQDLFTSYTPSRNLRSSSQRLLTVPKSASVSYGDRAFSIAAPKLWNALPAIIRSTETVSEFKTRLKTFLFSSL